MIIRKLERTDDRSAISHVYEVSWKYAYKGIIPQEYLDSIPEGKWAGNIDNEGRKSLLMIENDTVIGTSSYCKSRYSDMEGYGEIISIYLLPQYMGKGFGRKLLANTIEELEKMGYSNLFLWVLEENQRARHFYEKFGFGCSDIYLEDNIGGRALREVQYRFTV